MAFERLKKFLARLRPAELAIAQVLAAAAVIISAPTGSTRSLEQIVGFTEVDEAAFAVARPDETVWRNVNVYEIPVPEGAAWIDWMVPEGDLDRDAPTAVSMQGPFSATVYFNGEKIGEKGVPADAAKDETPGRIDATIAIPADLIRPGGNRLAIRFSAGRAGYNPASVVQGFQIEPYRADQRRDLRYYAPTLLFSGALVGVALGFVLLARSKNDGRLFWISAGLAGLVPAVTAEVMRAAVNYPYNWHQPRQALTGVGLCLFGFAIFRFSTLRWPARGQTVRITLAAAAAFVGAVWLTATGYDAKSSISSAMLVLGAGVWAGVFGGRRESRALAYALALAAFPIMAALAAVDFIDRSIYILAVCLFGYALMRAPDFLSPPVIEPKERKVLGVKGGSQVSFVPLETISMVKAAGNYSEVHQQNGEWKLDQRGLTAISRDLPTSFFRIHRSYVANLAHAVRLCSQEGSRYWLDLNNGQRLPVSRAKVKVLRDALGGMTDE